jgi:hypothetical protein
MPKTDISFLFCLSDIFHENIITRTRYFFAIGGEYMDVGTRTPDMAVLTGVPYSNTVIR